MAEGAYFCAACGKDLTTSPPAASPTTVPTGPTETSGKAIASLVLGFFAFFPLTAIIGVILGHLSLSDIRNSAGRLKGRGLAIAGLVMGYLGFAAIPFILIIGAIAIPNLLRAGMAANEASSVSSIRTINAAEAQYASMYPAVGYAADLKSLGGASPCTADQATACLIDNRLATATAAPGKSGYIFAAESSNNGTEYLVTAVPVTRSQTGNSSYCSSEDAVVRVSATGDAIADRAACMALPPLGE